MVQEWLPECGIITVVERMDGLWKTIVTLPNDMVQHPVETPTGGTVEHVIDAQGWVVVHLPGLNQYSAYAEMAGERYLMDAHGYASDRVQYMTGRHGAVRNMTADEVLTEAERFMQQEVECGW